MILTVDELRLFVSTELDDAAVQILLDAAERDILDAAGDPTEQTEYAQGGYPALVLHRPVSALETSGTDTSIISVTEASDQSSPLELEEDDYRVDGYILHRLTTGTNPRWKWWGLVKVVYNPPDRDAERERAQVALVKLDISVGSGITSERIGEYSVGYSAGRDHMEQRQAILDGLKPLMVG